MQKPGGIIALIGGIFGTLAAIFTLMAGGLVAGLEGASASSNIKGVVLYVEALNDGTQIENGTFSFSKVDRTSFYDPEDFNQVLTSDQQAFVDATNYLGAVGKSELDEDIGKIALTDPIPLSNASGEYTYTPDATDFNFSEFVNSSFELGTLTFNGDVSADLDFKLSGTISLDEGDFAFATSTIDII